MYIHAWALDFFHLWGSGCDRCSMYHKFGVKSIPSELCMVWERNVLWYERMSVWLRNIPSHYHLCYLYKSMIVSFQVDISNTETCTGKYIMYLYISCTSSIFLYILLTSNHNHTASWECPDSWSLMYGGLLLKPSSDNLSATSIHSGLPHYRPT